MKLRRRISTALYLACTSVLRRLPITPEQSRRVVEDMLSRVAGESPETAVRWLLDLNHRTEAAVDRQCIRWGKGVHLKHELMTGIHSFFYDRIPRGASVLDVGCGHGTVAHAIAEHADAEVVGVDMEAERIDFAKDRYRHPRLSFVCGDVTSCFPERRFDTIVLSSILEHLDDRTGFLRDLTSRYRPERFLIRVPTLERHYFVALRQKLGLFAMTDRTHRLEYSESGFREEMEAAGLRVVDLQHRWGDIWAQCEPFGAAGGKAD